jgi:group I intron endonuclease
MKISGIYQIQSKIEPERIYIGSAINVTRRWKCHLSDLRKNKHHSIKLQRHFNKYGENDLQFSVLRNCEKEYLIINEQSLIDICNPYFNICKIAGSPLGVKRSEETKKKISKLHKGRIFSTERKKQMSDYRKGKKLSKEHIEKLKYYSGENHPCYGKKCSPETKLKISNANKGRRPSEETKKKMSISQADKINSIETRLKISQGRMGIEPWNKGLKYNTEIKINMSKAAKKRWMKIKTE